MSSRPADEDGRRGAAGGHRVAGIAVSLMTVVAITGLTIALFFTPPWVSFEQERARVPAITGYTPEQVGMVTGAILADLFLGPPDFDVVVEGRPVLDAAERSHMMDVRALVLPFALALSLVVTALAAIVVRYRWQSWMWRAVARGSGLLALIGVAAGVVVLLMFDTAFLVFHLLFFPQGNFAFDPRIQRLTQLFPDQFWADTAMGIALVGLAIAVGAWLVARWAARHADRPGPHRPIRARPS